MQVQVQVLIGDSKRMQGQDRDRDRRGAWQAVFTTAVPFSRLLQGCLYMTCPAAVPRRALARTRVPGSGIGKKEKKKSTGVSARDRLTRGRRTP